MSSLPVSSFLDASALRESMVRGAVRLSATLSLDQLPRHCSAVVVDVVVGKGADDPERVLRLTEIGFVPGERVRVVARGFPGHEPIAVRVGRTTFALRSHEAALVRVAPEAR